MILLKLSVPGNDGNSPVVWWQYTLRLLTLARTQALSENEPRTRRLASCKNYGTGACGTNCNVASSRTGSIVQQEQAGSCQAKYHYFAPFHKCSLADNSPYAAGSTTWRWEHAFTCTRSWLSWRLIVASPTGPSVRKAKLATAAHAWICCASLARG